MRIVITGSPRAGKTSFADMLGPVLKIPVFHTDVAKDMEWSEASQYLSTWFDVDGGWIIEGTAVPRALRKWVSRQIPEGGLMDKVPVPFDRLVFMDNPREELELSGQKGMRSAVRTIMETFKPWIGDRWVDL